MVIEHAHEHKYCDCVSDHYEESRDSHHFDKFEESNLRNNNEKIVHSLHAIVLIGFGTDDLKGD